MELVGAKSNFACLVKFVEIVPPPIVFLAEAVFSSIFDAYKKGIYPQIRHPSLSRNEAVMSVNVADPLSSTDNGGWWTRILEKIRDKMFDKLERETELKIVRQKKCGHIKVGTALIPLTKGCLEILGMETASTKEDTVKVYFDLVHEGRHEHLWATLAKPTDEAYRLGIRVSNKDNVTRFVWVESNIILSVLRANSFVDSISGMIVQDLWNKSILANCLFCCIGRIKDVRTYEWGNNRFPFAGPYRHTFRMSKWRPDGDWQVDTLPANEKLDAK
jgi:hypothetical protein